MVCGEINPAGFVKCNKCGSSELLAAEQCPVCKAEREANADFCQSCGNVFNEDSTAQCRYCGESMSAKSDICPECGRAAVAEEDSERPVKKIVCPNCKQLNNDGEEFCSYCFFELIGSKTEELQMILKTSTNSSGVVQRLILSKDSAAVKLVCPRCESANSITEKYCMKCGRPFTVELTKRYCGSCGAENQGDAAFCVNCQSSFGGKKVSPEENYWTCSCSYENEFDSGFCIACGKSRHAR